MTKRISLAAIIIIALVLSITTYAFAAANTMPTASNAGQGDVTVSGYLVGTPHYTLDSANPISISSVSFTISALNGGAAPTTTKVQLLSGGSWFTCSVAAGTATCNGISGVSVYAADTFSVAAAD
jgi:hypothetical protein